MYVWMYTCACVYTTEESTQWLTVRQLNRSLLCRLQLCLAALAKLGGAFGAGRLRRLPRFARRGLATLGLAELRKWLSFAGVRKPLAKYSDSTIK